MRLRLYKHRIELLFGQIDTGKSIVLWGTDVYDIALWMNGHEHTDMKVLLLHYCCLIDRLKSSLTMDLTARLQSHRTISLSVT